MHKDHPRHIKHHMIHVIEITIIIYMFSKLQSFTVLEIVHKANFMANTLRHYMFSKKLQIPSFRKSVKRECFRKHT